MSWVVVKGKTLPLEEKNVEKSKEDEATPRKSLSSESQPGEVQRLQLENFKLKALLRECEGKLRDSESAFPPEMGDAARGLYKILEASSNHNMESSRSPTSKTQPKSELTEPKTSSSSCSSASESSESSESEGKTEDSRGMGLTPSKPSPFFASGAREGKHRSAIYVCKSPPKPQGAVDEDQDEAYVAVMDVEDEDWWEIIDPEKEDVEPHDDFGSDSSYVLVEQDELMNAISSFVTAALHPYPEIQDVAPDKLKELLDSAVNNLGMAEKGTAAKMYEWGTFAYTTYGWGSYVWHLYKDPSMVVMVAKGVVSAASWAMWIMV